MWTVNVSVFCLFFLNAFVLEYIVFEKGGFYGIKDENGEVSVPAVYEYLGWSGEQSGLRSGVIGYKQGNQWGLITAKNKVITEPKYYSITPFKENTFKAAIKGKFSNQLFFGILNRNGKTSVGFDYFSISKMEPHLLVSKYKNNKEHFGVISHASERLVSLNYQEILHEWKFLLARTFEGKTDVFNMNGRLICSSLDSIRRTEEGWIVLRNGYTGFISLKGNITYDLIYKDIKIDKGVISPVSFARWGIYEDTSLVVEIDADSICYDRGDRWQVYLNGVHYTALLDSTFHIYNASLMNVTDNHYLLKDVSTQKWFAMNTLGNKFLEHCDSIYATNFVLWGKKNNTWEAYNENGKQKNRFSYQSIRSGVEGQFISKVNDYLGIIDSIGAGITHFKYDEIVSDTEFYKVKYLGKWGIMNQKGRWIMPSEFSEVFVRNKLFIGRKGEGYTYYGLDGVIVKNTYRPLTKKGSRLLVQDEEGLIGLLDESGDMVVYPTYDAIHYWDGLYELVDGNTAALIDSQGTMVFGPEEEIQKVGGIGEGYLLIKKNDRWGFLDLQGRLRISNRYRDARPFSEGLAAVKLREKWGFINKHESLVIQPYYEEVTDFKDGLSIVSLRGQFGLINAKGNEIVTPSWKKIKRLSTGNYLVRNNDDKVGLISSSGTFLLRPSFDNLEDMGEKVIISQMNKKGIFDYSGNQLFRTTYREIKVFDKITLLQY
ncbi:MAG: WG repeat-containing protein [Bacteroidota bacterium]